MEWTCRAMAELRGYLEARDQQRPEGPAPDNDPVEHAYQLSLTLAVKRWEALMAKEEQRDAVIPAKAGIQ